MRRGIQAAQPQLALQRIDVGRKRQGVRQDLVARPVRMEEGRQQLMQVNGRRVGDDHLFRRGADQRRGLPRQLLRQEEPGRPRFQPAAHPQPLPVVQRLQHRLFGRAGEQAERVAVQIDGTGLAVKAGGKGGQLILCVQLPGARFGGIRMHGANRLCAFNTTIIDRYGPGCNCVPGARGKCGEERADKPHSRQVQYAVMRLLTMLKSKIHRATVTQADVNYIGSIAIDPDLIERAGLLPNELVHVWNIDNGARFETYVIAGRPGSGEIVVNGAAAHRVQVGHKVIITAFCLTDEPVTPRAILVDDHNRYVRDL
jgi:aspartate 1-decarboxylase